MNLAYANKHPRELGFPLDGIDRRKTAAQLTNEALSPFMGLLEKDFNAGFHELITV